MNSLHSYIIINERNTRKIFSIIEHASVSFTYLKKNQVLFPWWAFPHDPLHSWFLHFLKASLDEDDVWLKQSGRVHKLNSKSITFELLLVVELVVDVELLFVCWVCCCESFDNAAVVGAWIDSFWAPAKIRIAQKLVDNFNLYSKQSRKTKNVF